MSVNSTQYLYNYKSVFSSDDIHIKVSIGRYLTGYRRYCPSIQGRGDMEAHACVSVSIPFTCTCANPTNSSCINEYILGGQK